MDKQYSVQFFTRFVEAMQKFCRDYIEFEQAVELSGYLSVEIDNYKKERYVLSEMVHNTGDVISESYCVKAFKTMKRLPPKSSDSDIVLRDNTNTRRSGGYTDSQSSHQNIPSYRSRIHPAGISHAGHPSNFSQQSPSQKYGQSPMRRNQPPSFAQGSPVHRESQESLASKNRSQQIQPRQSIQVPESRGQKRPSTDGTGDGQNKKEKTDTDLESLYNAATNIVCSTDSTATTQSDTASTTLSQPVSTSSESIRLPLTDILTIKEENDVILLDDEGGGPNQMGDSQLDVSSFGNDSNSGSNLLDNSSLGSGDMFGASMSGPGDGNPSTSSMSNDPMSSMQEVPVNEEGEFPYIYMYSRHPRKSMRERLVKAVCKFPGSVINPRLLQKRLFGAQISQVKIELDYLESCGFGKLTLFEKQIGIKPKWRFVKLHPDELNLENALHYEMAFVSHRGVNKGSWLSLRTKLIRAICKYPGPLVPVRELQRLVSGPSVDDIKFHLGCLEQEGFGEVKLLSRNTARLYTFFLKAEPEVMPVQMMKELLSYSLTREMYQQMYNNFDAVDKDLIQVYLRHCNPAVYYEELLKKGFIRN